MTRYYFDLRDRDGLFADEEGLELRDIDAAHQEAIQSMIDAARDSFLKPVVPDLMVVEVRDEHGPVVHASFKTAIVIKRRQ